MCIRDSCVRKAHAQLLLPTIPRHMYPYHLEERIDTLWYIYGNYLLQQIEPSGWKGFVTYGLGADTSLPHCLATGIWTLVQKATSGPKSRGASFGTTLWRHVQRYCSHFLLFMQIRCGYIGNLDFRFLLFVTLISPWILVSSEIRILVTKFSFYFCVCFLPKLQEAQISV